MARLGRAQAFAPFQFGALAAAEGADVTIALTGQAVTASLGALSPALAKAITGQAIAASGGALAPAIAVALVGSSASVQQGAVRVEGIASESGAFLVPIVRRRLFF